jgi:hypothetical protein
LAYLGVPPKYHLAMKTAVQTLRLQLKKAKALAQTKSGRDE